MVAALTACASNTDAVLQSLQYVFRKDTAASQARLNPSFRYLRATLDGREVLLVLGYVDNDLRGPIQVWYSGQREVLRIQNGRIVGAVGLNAEWRNVYLPELPQWSQLARTKDKFLWQRVRDIMPGYRFGVSDALALRVMAPPAKSALLDLDPSGLTWFEEEFATEPRGRSSTAENILPAARYAVSFRSDVETVVYGEQCLTPILCFTWQLWPAQPLTVKDTR